MNEAFEKILMKDVRALLFANWLADIAELFKVPFSDYTRIHRQALCTHLSELVTTGLRYAKYQREDSQSFHNGERLQFYTCIISCIEKFVDALTDDEYIYLFHLRNHACHIFAIAYDYINLDGTVKSEFKTTLLTKSGRKEFNIEELEKKLKTTICGFGASDIVFMEYIYNKSKEVFIPMFEEYAK